MAGVLLAVILIVVYVLIPSGGSDIYENPERVAGILADYRRDMEAKPSAKIAGKVLDFAIASGKPELVFTVLKENIYPWAGTGGVEAEFIKGSQWYIKNNAQVDNVLWLAEGIHKLDLAAQFNEDLTDYFLSFSDNKAVQYGNVLFADWTLNAKAREHYLSSLIGLWESNNLPVYTGGEFNDIKLFDFQHPLQLVDAPEFKDVSLYLHLWITCWKGNLDEEFVNSLLQLSTESDPLDLYRRLWAVALLRDLGEKWHNPLGLDVAAKLPEVFPVLGAEEIEILYSRRDLKSREQNLLLLELMAGGPKVGIMQEREAAAMLICAAGYEEAELDKLIIHTDQYRAASPDVLDVYNRLSENYADSFYFQRAEAILGQAAISPFKLEKSAEFAVHIYKLNFSRVAPAALINSDSGLTLLNLSTLKETHYPGCLGEWSIKGDCFALLKPSESEPIIRIMSPEGTEKSRFALANPLPKVMSDIPINRVDWYGPWDLDIVYRYSNLELDDLEANYGSLRFRFNINTQSLQEISIHSPWRPYQNIPGTDLYYQYGQSPNSDLIDTAGKKRGTILFPSAKTCHFQGLVFSVQEEALFVEIDGTARKVLDKVYELRWVAAKEGEEELIVSVNTLEWEETYLAINRKDWTARLINPGPAWYDTVSYILFQGGQQQKIIDDSDWHYLGNEWGDGQARNVNISADGGSLPILFTGEGVELKMIKVGDHYILLLCFGNNETWMLKYRLNP